MLFTIVLSIKSLFINLYLILVHIGHQGFVALYRCYTLQVNREFKTYLLAKTNQVLECLQDAVLGSYTAYNNLVTLYKQVLVITLGVLKLTVLLLILSLALGKEPYVVYVKVVQNAVGKCSTNGLAYAMLRPNTAVGLERAVVPWVPVKCEIDSVKCGELGLDGLNNACAVSSGQVSVNEILLKVNHYHNVCGFTVCHSCLFFVTCAGNHCHYCNCCSKIVKYFHFNSKYKIFSDCKGSANRAKMLLLQLKGTHMNKTIFTIAVAAVTFMSCSENRNNPFFEESKLPYGAVEFDKIQSTDYLPAFEEGFRQFKADIDAVAACPDAPTFENTIEALESSGELLNRVNYVFMNLMETDADDLMKETEEKVNPMQTEADSYLYMNDAIFKRVSALYDKRESIGLTAEQIKVLEKYYRRFVNGGARLDDKAKARFVEIQNRLGELRIKFANNNLDESNSYLLHVTDIRRLEGLPQDQLDAAATRAREKGLDGWAFNVQKPCWIPFLQYCQDRDLREQMYKAYYTRGNNNNQYDNKEIIKEILQLRLELANLLGYETFADYMLEDRMAKTPQAAYDLLMEIWQYAVPQAKRERDEMQKIIDAEGGKFKLAAWDWWYYAEKLRKQKYDLDESQLMP